MGAFERAVAYSRLVRLSHTVFALPFAVMGAVLAAGGVPGLRTSLLILLAMVSARTAGMTMNRIADEKIDALRGVGIEVADSPADMGDAMKRAMVAR